MFREGIMDVVRTCSLEDGTRRQYRTEDGIRNVIGATDMGLVRLVPHNKHVVSMLDRHWHVAVGVELTDFGRAEAAR